MADVSSRIHVMRRITLVGKASSPENCASFAEEVEAVAFIQRAIAPFAEIGSDGIRWWCKQNGNLEVEYWLVFPAMPVAEVDRLVEDLVKSERTLIEQGDDGAILDDLVRGTCRPADT